MQHYAIDSRYVNCQRFWVDATLNDRECMSFLACQLQCAHALDYDVLKTQRQRKLLMAYSISFENYRTFLREHTINRLMAAVIETDCHAIVRYVLEKAAPKVACFGVAVIFENTIKFIAINQGNIQTIFDASGDSYLALLRRLIAQYGYDEEYIPIEEVIVVSELEKLDLGEYQEQQLPVESIASCIQQGLLLRWVR